MNCCTTSDWFTGSDRFRTLFPTVLTGRLQQSIRRRNLWNCFLGGRIGFSPRVVNQIPITYHHMDPFPLFLALVVMSPQRTPPPKAARMNITNVTVTSILAGVSKRKKIKSNHKPTTGQRVRVRAAKQYQVQSALSLYICRIVTDA